MNLVYEPKKIIDVTKSQATFKRALNCIPAGIYGHLGPSEGCMVPVSSYPLYMDHAQGAYIYDIDGNRIIDYMCGYGPNYLGYNDPDVDAAAAAQRKKGDCTTLISDITVEFAEEVCKTINMADWAFFAKNGNDVTQFAMMIARAYTGRKKMVLTKGWYHGVSPWTQNSAIRASSKKTFATTFISSGTIPNNSRHSANSTKDKSQASFLNLINTVTLRITNCPPRILAEDSRNLRQIRRSSYYRRRARGLPYRHQRFRLPLRH